MKVANQKRKKKPRTKVHMSISIPRKLRIKMDEYQLKNYVNWSEVAAEAFTKQIGK